MPRITKPSPDPYRVRFARHGKWNIDPTVTDDHRLFKFLPSFGGWNKQQHEDRAIRWLNQSRKLDSAYMTAVARALHSFGDHGALISGVVRDHFPPDVKHNLRRLAHGSTELRDRSLAHWRAAGRHIQTWRAL